MLHYLSWLLVLFGHAALWIAVFNRIHALDLSCRMVKLSEQLLFSILTLGAVIWTGLALPAAVLGRLDIWKIVEGRPGLFAYIAICAGAGLFVASVWLWRRFTHRRLPHLVSNDTNQLDVAAELGHRPIGSMSVRWMDRIPGNQMFKLHVHEETLVDPQLPPALEGMTIAHLSDLHFTGRISKEYFDYVIDRANDLDADLVAVTGDILDKEHCLEWIPSTLGRLRSRLGAYFILGNHDKRLRDESVVRKTLVDAGLVDLGRRAVRVVRGGQPLLLSGNELPWFGPPPDPQAELPGDESPYRILLSHSPDQFGWARRHGFHLMLCGHTHGGQIHVPLVGPVLSPCAHGIRYAIGMHYEAPTLMHVSRGISAMVPFRFNCAPELAKLVLLGRN